MSSGLSTMPKRGACSKRMRRSFSPSWPVMRACSGALKSAVAGTSWIWPSVTMMAPPMREGGTSRKSAVERGEQARLGALVDRIGHAGLDDAHVELLETRQPLLERGNGFVGLLVATADVLALAAVDDQGDDALQRVALLVEQHRIDHRQRKCGEGGEPQQRTALAQHQSSQRQQGDRHQQRRQQWPGQQRFEGERPVHLTAPTVRAAPARAPGRICSCRSACT